MEIRILDPSDVNAFTALLKIFSTVFEKTTPLPAADHLAGLLKNPDFKVIVATEGEEVSGGLTVFVLHTYQSTSPSAYIYDVGVAPQWQGRGIGKALMDYTCSWCRKNGFSEAWVEAVAEDTAAVNFYRQTDFSSEMAAIHFTYSFGEPPAPGS